MLQSGISTISLMASIQPTKLIASVTTTATTLAILLMQQSALTLTWSTGVAGRDRGNINKQNIYSSWVQAGYTLYNDDKFKVDASVAGAFALNNYKENDGANFYGKTTGINDVRLGCTYKLKIGNHPLPITSQAMWNPEANKGYFRVAVNLLDL